MARFSLQRLFVSVGLIAIGCAAFALTQKARIVGNLLPAKSEKHILAGGMLMIVGAFFLGAGFGNLFRRPILGATLGLLLTLAVIVGAFGVSTLAQ